MEATAIITQIQHATRQLTQAQADGKASIRLLHGDRLRGVAHYYFRALGCVITPITERQIYIIGDEVSLPTRPMPIITDQPHLP